METAVGVEFGAGGEVGGGDGRITPVSPANRSGASSVRRRNIVSNLAIYLPQYGKECPLSRPLATEKRGPYHQPTTPLHSV